MMAQGTRLGNQCLGACVPKTAAAVGMLWLGVGWAYVCWATWLALFAFCGLWGGELGGEWAPPPIWGLLGACWVPCCDIVPQGPY